MWSYGVEIHVGHWGGGLTKGTPTQQHLNSGLFLLPHNLFCPFGNLSLLFSMSSISLLVFTAKVPKSDHTIQCFRTYSVLSWTHQLHKVQRRYFFFYVFKRCSNPKMLRGSATSPAWQLSSWTLHRCCRFWPQVLFGHAGEKAPAPSECCHRGGTCESEDRLESLFPILNPTKKIKKKKNTWSECIENSRPGAQQREKLVELRKRLCPFAFYVLGESARVNRVTAKYKMSLVNVF